MAKKGMKRPEGTGPRPGENAERPIPAEVYPVVDTDLGRDNLENDLPAADRSEL